MKTQVGIEKGSYAFSVSGKTVTFSGLGTLALEQIFLITNVKTGKTLYQFNDESLKATLAGSVLTLNNAADLTGASDSDNLFIMVNLFDAPLITIMDEVSANVIYIGYAQSGTDPSAAAHQICKVDFTNPSSKKWAGGGASNQVWNDRATLTYT